MRIMAVIAIPLTAQFPSVSVTIALNAYMRGYWDFRFCSFGCFFRLVFWFLSQKTSDQFFGFGVHCGLQIFCFFSIWFSVFGKYTSIFSVLVSDVVFVL